MSAPKGKRCPRCGQVKPASAFYRRRRTLRLSPYCKPCQRTAAGEARRRRRDDPASVAKVRAVDRTRQRRRRALRGEPPPGGDAA
jgi:hypothetical protein